MHRTGNLLVESKGIDRDPRSRKQIYEFLVNEQDEIRRAYLIASPYQPGDIEYPYKEPKNHRRSFQSSWFESHSNWLEYSPFSYVYIELDSFSCLFIFKYMMIYFFSINCNALIIKMIEYKKWYLPNKQLLD